MLKTGTLPDTALPDWYDGKHLDEVIFCQEFLEEHPMKSVNGAFFTVNGRVSDENLLKKQIYEQLKPYVTSGLAKKVSNLLDVLRVECYTPSLPVHRDRLNVANGTLYLDGRFSTEKDYCRNRLPVAYQPDAPPPAGSRGAFSGSSRRKSRRPLSQVTRSISSRVTPLQRATASRM